MRGKRKKGNWLLVLSLVAVVGFGAAFAYNAYVYWRWWRDGQIALENTEIALEIFSEQMVEIEVWVAALPEVLEGYDGGVPVLVVSLQEISDGVDVEEGAAPAAPVLSPMERLVLARERTGNPDIVGFLFIEGTTINNVVVQGEDNEFYLYRDMFRNRNVNGAIFLDYRNSRDFDDFNTIIYGHNMNNGTMFHNLRYFMRRDFFENHRHITMVTETRILIYEIFSVFQTNVDFDYIQVFFRDRQEFGGLVEEIVRRRAFDTGVLAGAYDNLLILSTCTNVTEDTRIVVAGRLAGIIEIEE